MISEATLKSFIGKKFNKLLILSIAEPQKRCDGRNHNTVLCKCDCGIIKQFLLTHVSTGHSKSCGCLRVEESKRAQTTHGQAYNPIYNVWCGMKDRCTNPNELAYKNYGGRGIKLCDEWLNDRSIFFNWAMNNGYRKGLEIDRIDNNGNYEPGNCHFITKRLNARNKRNTQYFTYNNETKSLPEWAEILNVDYQLINKRVWRGWDFKKAVETPNMKVIPEPNQQSKLFAV